MQARFFPLWETFVSIFILKTFILLYWTPLAYCIAGKVLDLIFSWQIFSHGISTAQYKLSILILTRTYTIKYIWIQRFEFLFDIKIISETKQTDFKNAYMEALNEQIEFFIEPKSNKTFFSWDSYEFCFFRYQFSPSIYVTCHTKKSSWHSNEKFNKRQFCMEKLH